LADADCAAEIVVQQRVFQNAHSGVGCERLVIRAGRGTRVYLEHAIPPAQVIDELKIHLWVKGDRPGFQVMARVVLPKTLDRRTGQPVTTLVWGTLYRDVGAWQALTISNLPKLVQRQVRILSSERAEPVDGRQAYIDKIVINAFGGTGLTQLWVDDLDLDGHATPAWYRDGLAPAEAVSPTGVRFKDSKVIAASAERSFPTEGSRQPRVGLQGSVLVANGRPLFPRGVIHRGESLSWLKSLGFNTAILSESASLEQQAAAERLDLWFVVPSQSDLRPIDPAKDRILAVLGSPPAAEDAVPAEVERPAAASGRLHLIREPVGSDPRATSRAWGDLFIAEFPPATGELGPSSPESNAGRPATATLSSAPNRPTWALVETERLVRQVLDRAPASTDQRQHRYLNALRNVAFRCVSEGARGWCLTNALPEALPDSDVPLWTEALEVVQRELDLINPWISAGTVAAPLAEPAPGWRACALEANRARLVILSRQSMPSATLTAGATNELKRSAAARGAWGETTRRFISASVPPTALLNIVDVGAPTSADAYLLGGATLRPLTTQRVAGGVRVQVEAPEVAALVVLTQDPLVVNYLARRDRER